MDFELRVCKHPLLDVHEGTLNGKTDLHQRLPCIPAIRLSYAEDTVTR